MATNGEFCRERPEHSIQKYDAGSKASHPQTSSLDIGATAKPVWLPVFGRDSVPSRTERPLDCTG